MSFTAVWTLLAKNVKNICFKTEFCYKCRGTLRKVNVGVEEKRKIIGSTVEFG